MSSATAKILAATFIMVFAASALGQGIENSQLPSLSVEKAIERSQLTRQERSEKRAKNMSAKSAEKKVTREKSFGPRSQFFNQKSSGVIEEALPRASAGSCGRASGDVVEPESCGKVSK